MTKHAIVFDSKGQRRKVLLSIRFRVDSQPPVRVGVYRVAYRPLAQSHRYQTWAGYSLWYGQEWMEPAGTSHAAARNKDRPDRYSQVQCWWGLSERVE